MIYKFKSKATADLIMLGPHGDAVMRLLGRALAVPGIIEVADMPRVIALLERAMAEDEASNDPAKTSERHVSANSDGAHGNSPQADIDLSLRQRLWPLLENIKRAHAQAQPIVWGV
jgi:Domain of unknown function (DUF1840)